MAVVGMIVSFFVGGVMGMFFMAMMQVSKEADNAGRHEMDEGDSDGAHCADADCECGHGVTTGRLQAQRQWTFCDGDGTTAADRQKYLLL